MSQLLLRLQRDLALSTDTTVRAELTARMACVLARLGRFEEANKAVLDLRTDYGDGRSGRVTVWIMLAEGLIHWYGELSPQALDRVTRAQLLGRAMGYSAAIAIASAWRSHFEFEVSDFDAMFRSLDLAIQHADPSNHDALGRIAIVFCNVYSICGDWVNARRWFSHGRDHAIKEGDQASIEALQYNRAVLGLNWVRTQSCLGRFDEGALRIVRLEYQSARNFQALTQNKTLLNHSDLCGARLLLLEEKFQQAVEALQLSRSGSPFTNHNFTVCLIDLEVAYCLFRQGRIAESLATLEGVDFTLLSEMDIDEQLAAMTMRCEMAAADSRFGELSHFEVLRLELLDAYQNLHNALVQGLAKYDAERLSQQDA